VGIGLASLAANSIYSLSQSQMGQAMMQQSADHASSGFTGWKAVYYLWPNLFGTQQSAATLIGNDGGVPVYPLMNVLFYCLILGVLLFLRFRNEEIV
jgi:hypothetical protein